MAMFAVFVLLMIILSWIYLIPKALEYNKLSGEISRMAGNTTQIVEVLEDFRKMQNFNRYVRNMLGIKKLSLSDSQDYFSGDSLDFNAFEMDPVSEIVVLENIPSTIPVNGVITQKYSAAAILHEDNHYGIDIAGREGTAINASASGLVVYSGWNDVYGNIVILDHGDKYNTVYGHNSVNLVNTRDRVQRGQCIALMGNTGRSTGPHLHFEIWVDGDPENPVNYISEYREE